MTGLVTPTMTETVSGEFIDLADPILEQIHINDVAWAISRQTRYAGHTMSKIPYTVAQHTVMVSRYVEEALTPDTELHSQFRRYLDDQFRKALDTRGEEKANTVTQKWSNIIDHHNWVGGEATAGNRRMYAFHGLMHDFAEAYLVDLPTPVKRLPGVYEAYKKYELMWDAAMYMRFQLGYGPKGIMSLGDLQHPAMWEFGLAVVGWADMYALLIEAYHFMPSRAKNWNINIEGPSLSKIYNFRWPVSNEEAYLELLARFDELKTPETIYE